MLIEFSVANYLSFKDKVTFSMAAGKSVKLKDSNTFSARRGLRLLKSAVIYGANASGKSNLISAIDFMRRFVINSSSELQKGDAIPVSFFKLNKSSETRTSFFEVIFIINEQIYRYGFEADSERVEREWLYKIVSDEEELFFERAGDNFALGKFKEGKGLIKMTRNNALFISVCANFNGKISGVVLEWFMKMRVISGINEQQYRVFSIKFLTDDLLKKKILEMIRIADLNINDFTKVEEEFDKKSFNILDEEIKRKLLDKNVKNELIKTYHTQFDEQNHPVGFVEFDLDRNESQGTQKFFLILGPIFDTLVRGSVLFIDEMDSQLHPLLTRLIVKLFNSNIENENNAQFIFNTHNTYLLKRDLFRRDQIWFTEKDKYGATDLYSLAEFKTNRSESFSEDDYIKGKYGAIPFIGDKWLIQYNQRNGEKDGRSAI